MYKKRTFTIIKENVSTLIMKNKIDRSHIISKLSKKFNIDIEKSDRSVKTILDTMKLSLSNNDRIEIRGLGSFQVKEYAPRKARNPKTGESVNLNTQHQIQFKAGEPLRKKVNKSNPS